MRCDIVPLASEPEFLDACVAWSYAEWGSQVPTRNLMKVREDYMANIGNTAPPLTWVAVCDGKPAGMIRLKEIDHIEREDLKPWLSSLYVHPRYRGREIARQLCAHVHQTARETFFYGRIYLFTGSAQAFYEKLGYKRIGTVQDRSGFYTDGQALMMKTLGEDAHV
jgi:predicted N-acetyltransferase YhbS